MVVGEVGEDVEQRVVRGGGVGDDERRDTTAARVDQRRAEVLAGHVHTGEIGDGIRPGHERERVLGHDHDVEETEREGRPRHARAGDREHGRNRAGHQRDLTCQLAPRVQRGDVLAQFGAGRVELADQRDAQLAGQAHRAFHRLAAAAPIAPWCSPPAIRNHMT